MTQRTCRECGTTYHSSRRTATCSLPCRLHRGDRRAQAAWTPAERLRVLDRDDWTCGICHNPIDPEATWPSPQSACVDHIVAVAEGGEHSMNNAQAAHLRCNAQKGPHWGGAELVTIKQPVGIHHQAHNPQGVGPTHPHT